MGPKLGKGSKVSAKFLSMTQDSGSDIHTPAFFPAPFTQLSVCHRGT